MSSPPKNRKKKSGAAPAPNCQLSVDTSTMGTIVAAMASGGTFPANVTERGVSALVEPSSYLGILALVVLSDDDEIDICRPTVSQRRPHSREEPDRPQVNNRVTVQACDDKRAMEGVT